MDLDPGSINRENGGKSKDKTQGIKKGTAPAVNVLNLGGQSYLVDASRDYWSKQCTNPDERKDYIDSIQAIYQNILSEFIDTANACVDQTNNFEGVNRKWRWIVILGTGIVAIINILAANFVSRTDQLSSPDVTNRITQTPNMDIAIIFAVSAAVAAAVLTVLANLENFTGAQRRALGFRQARERFLDASRDYEQLWVTYVNSFYPRAEACFNSMILYRMLVEKDKELRDRLIEITKPKGQET
jgi:hypothetical protein